MPAVLKTSLRCNQTEHHQWKGGQNPPNHAYAAVSMYAPINKTTRQKLADSHGQNSPLKSDHE
jgi:hypothetical protein